MAVIIAKIHLRIFSECPKTSDHNSNATPFKEVQCLDALSKGRAQVDIKRKLSQSAHITLRLDVAVYTSTNRLTNYQRNEDSDDRAASSSSPRHPGLRLHRQATLANR